MRLADKNIIERLASTNGSWRLIITPMLFAEHQIGPSSIDVHLGTEYCLIDTSTVVTFDPIMSLEDFSWIARNARTTKRLSPEMPFILHPGELVLASTLEWIRIPSDLVARLDGRSRWARLGLKVHSTAGDVQPGSYGVVVFELENDGGVPFKLYTGMRVAQLSFDETKGSVAQPYGQKRRRRLQGQLGPSIGPYPDDEELKIIRRISGRHAERAGSA